MISNFYFAYGSNLDADQMRERCPGSRALHRARLPDHRLDFTHLSQHWSGGAADVIPEPDAEVWGAVYEMSDPDWRRLDGYEAGYERFLLTVETDAGDRCSVVSYHVLQKFCFQPSRLYLDKMIRWAGHWELPQNYIDQLRRISAIER